MIRSFVRTLFAMLAAMFAIAAVGQVPMVAPSAGMPGWAVFVVVVVLIGVAVWLYVRKHPQAATTLKDDITMAHVRIVNDLTSALDRAHNALETLAAKVPAPITGVQTAPTSSAVLGKPDMTIQPVPVPAPDATATTMKDATAMLPLTGEVLFKLLVVIATGQHDASLEAALGAQYNAYKNQYGPGGAWYDPEQVSEAGRASGLPQFWPARFAWAGYQARGYGSAQGDKWVWSPNLLGPFAQWYKP